ncbi:hypothetical protein HDU97_005151 [Phlyctochytrium planicorne]|nr:hypothetical protein HDU97_005151 [Phlyctochytrium planicorne]
MDNKEFGHEAFISYSQFEFCFASLLTSLLQERGLTIFLNKRCLGSSQTGSEYGIDDSAVIIYLLSKPSLEAMSESLRTEKTHPFLEEMKRGLERQKTQGTTIAPVMIGSYTITGTIEKLTPTCSTIQDLPDEARAVVEEVLRCKGFSAHPRDPELSCIQLIQGRYLQELPHSLGQPAPQ